MNSMVGFIRSLTQFDGFLVEREDLKLKEESSDMTQFVQTPSWKEGKHVQTLSTSMPHHCTYGQLSYTQDNWMGIRKFSRFTYRIFTPVSLKTTVELKRRCQHLTFAKTCEFYIVNYVQCRDAYPTKYTLLFLRYLYYNITQNIP